MLDALFARLVLGLLIVGEVMCDHTWGKHHIEMAAALSSSMSMAPFCKPQTSLKCIEAETLWSKFIAMLNIPSGR